MVEAKHVAKARTALSMPTPKRVLFVEGTNDEAVYGKWLAKLDPLFARRLEVIECGGRWSVLKALDAFVGADEVFALVDRDEWDAARVAEHQSRHPHLLVNLSRQAVESYFCDPAEVAAALAGSATSLAALGAVTADLPLWVDHWALRTTLERVNSRMRAERFPALFHDDVPLPSDATIQQALGLWSGLTDQVVVFEAFESVRSAARAAEAATQLRSCVYSKAFFRRIVLPALQTLAADDGLTWMVGLADAAPVVPVDLEPLLAKVLR